MSDAHALASFDPLLDDDYERHYHQAPCGYLSTTPDGLILRVNDTFLGFAGRRREELIGRRFAELLTAGGRIYNETHLAPMLQLEGRVSEIALELVRGDGVRVPVLLNAALERDADGAPALVRLAVFEATARRGYEQELLLAKRRAEESEGRAQTLARTLQQTLIPPALPQIPGVEVAAVYRAADDGGEIGGDFYDVFELGPDDWAITIGDVCGKGVEAAIVSSLARHTLRAAAVRAPQPSLVLDTLNRVLLQHETDRFCTAAFIRLQRRAAGWTVTTCVGGHPLPLIVRAGEPPADLGTPGTLLGILETPTLGDTETRLGDGDTIVLYTDGVTEGSERRGSYGGAGLKESIVRHAGSASTVADGVLADALASQVDGARDDAAVVVVRIAGEREGDRRAPS